MSILRIQALNLILCFFIDKVGIYIIGNSNTVFQFKLICEMCILLNLYIILCVNISSIFPPCIFSPKIDGLKFLLQCPEYKFSLSPG